MKKVIAIDPGYQQSGIAKWEGDKFVEMMSLDYEDLRDYISDHPSFYFLVENSNLATGNWHGPTARENVAKNKARSEDIVNYCKKVGVIHEQLKPDRYTMRYSDKKGRFSPFCRQKFKYETGWEGRSNKDSRAAAAMIVVWLKDQKFHAKIKKAQR